MALTLEQALALPQAEYLTPQEADIDLNQVIKAGMSAVVVTNPTSVRPIVRTDGFAPCMCIAVENMRTSTIALAHVSRFWKESLAKMIGGLRRSPSDPLQIHMLGGCYDTETCAEYANLSSDARQKMASQNRAAWEGEMRGVLDVINASPNVELITFDVGHKPHPDSVAFIKVAGKTRLVRGSADYTSFAQLEEPGGDMWLDIEQDLHGAREVYPPSKFKATAEEPFAVAWDGRLPKYQMKSGVERIAPTKIQYTAR